MSAPEPIWRSIPEFQGYEVSNTGEIRSWMFRGEVRNVPRPITPYLSAKGQWVVKINNKTRTISLLVLYAFRGAPLKGQIHRAHFHDNDPSNCRLENLSWKTDPGLPNPELLQNQ